MSLDAIQKITGAEQTAQARKAEAAAAAKKLVTDAQREGEALIAKARADAEAHNKSLLQQAEQRAAQAAEEIMANAARDAEAMCSAAQGKLEQAADLIVEKVVKL